MFYTPGSILAQLRAPAPYKHPLQPIQMVPQKPLKGQNSNLTITKAAHKSSPRIVLASQTRALALHFRSAPHADRLQGSALQIDADTIRQVCNQFEIVLQYVLPQTDCNFHFSFPVKQRMTGKVTLQYTC